MVNFTCLLLDDDAGFAGMLAKVVAEQGGKPVACHTIAAARAALNRQPFDLAILDNRLPDGTGFEFYPELLRAQPAVVAVMITGGPELSQAVELTRNGLFDYITKPLGVPELTALLNRAKLRLRTSESPGDGAELLGDSPALKEVARQLKQAAQANATVLLLGETGTGKDVAARYLHRLTFGAKADSAAYVPLNCPNVPAEMFEAELFGSEKGAYTGADRRRVGLVDAAQAGTLFLDEVAEIPFNMQSKLLRFLESREYRRLGDPVTLKFTGRVVAATNRDLQKEVQAGRFREDLLYRLDVFSVRLPPLREHAEDVEPIAEALLRQICQRYQRTKPALQTADLGALRGYAFPGNVRELRNLLERSLLRTDPGSPFLTMDLAWLKGRPAAAAPGPAVSLPGATRQLPALEQQEYQLIAKALQEERGGIRRAAAKLGITHQALLRRLERWPELRQVGSQPPQ